jgi:hypothetical protein
MTDFVTAEALAAGLPYVLEAPKSHGPVRILCTRSRPNQRVFPERITLTRAGGVEGDFEMNRPWLTLEDGRPDPRIQVSILPLRVLDLVWRDRTAQAHPGDTIIADFDISLTNLPANSLVRVGTAVLRVSDIWNDGCVKWKVRYGRPAVAWIAAPEHEQFRLRGILCSVEQDGEVSIGDMMYRP